MATSPKKKVPDGMVLHGIKFKPVEWEDAEEVAALIGSDNVSAFVREAVREKVARERKTRPR